jgi:hypothetical protein
MFKSEHFYDEWSTANDLLKHSTEYLILLNVDVKYEMMPRIM